MKKKTKKAILKKIKPRASKPRRQSTISRRGIRAILADLVFAKKQTTLGSDLGAVKPAKEVKLISFPELLSSIRNKTSIPAATSQEPPSAHKLIDSVVQFAATEAVANEETLPPSQVEPAAEVKTESLEELLPHPEPPISDVVESKRVHPEYHGTPVFWSSPYQLDLNKQSSKKSRDGLIVPEGRLASGTKARIDLLQASDVQTVTEAAPELLTKPKLFRPVFAFASLALFICVPFLSLAYYHKVADKGQFFNRVISSINNLPSVEARETTPTLTSLRQEVTEANSLLDQLIREMPKLTTKFTGGVNLFLSTEKIAEVLPHLQNDLGDILNSGKNQPLTVKVRRLVDNLIAAAPFLTQSARSLKEVPLAIIPDQYRSRVEKLQDFLPVLEKSLQRLLIVGDTVLELLGENQQRRYLVVFQNNSEIRPTGGFIGSLALMDIYQGKIRNLEVPEGGAYDFKGSLLARVISPQPLHLVNPIWQLQDANWYFDWPTSAKKISWFYQKSGGPSVDGVIALNTFVLKELLKITGEIDLPKFNKKINAENFLEELQKAVEIEYQDPKKPKAIIGELAPQVLKRIFELEGAEYLKVAEVLNRAARQKDLMISVFDPRLQSKIASLGWQGEVKSTTRDYLAVVNANISGGKTDAVIKESIRHQAEIKPNGEVYDTVTIQRRHDGVKGTPFTGIKNINYLRVYVPEGSELIDAHGFEAPAESYFIKVPEDYLPDAEWGPIEESAQSHAQTGTQIYRESGKTVFANWTQIEPGETKTLYLKYKLPFNLKFKKNESRWEWLDNFRGIFNLETNEYTYYSLLIQKQSGSWDRVWQTKISAPADWQKVWHYAENIKSDNDLEISEGVLDSDKFLGIIFRKQPIGLNSNE